MDTKVIINNSTLYLGDCLEVMSQLISKGTKVDAIITDPPYGTTACKWDSVIPFDMMWANLNQLIKPNGAIALFGSEPFSSVLRVSNLRNYKYDWTWDKVIPSGMSYARYQPMRRTEQIMVFTSGGSCTYTPQMVLRDKPIKKGGNKHSDTAPIANRVEGFKKTYTHKHPTNILEYPKVRQGSLHPTQKPVDLLEYLINTYTQEGETVLDFTMGSGTTGVACKNTNRCFIGIEKDVTYFNIAAGRIGNMSLS